MAGRNANGAMLLHTNDACRYSLGWDYCGDTGPYSAPLPATCDELVTTTTRPTDVESIIWMVAAFPYGSSPAVKSFQTGIYGDITEDWFSAWGFCPANGLEIPDATWPAPNSGTAVTYLFPAITSHLFKMYWFACGAPFSGAIMRTGDYVGGDHHAEWADDSDPAVIDYCFQFGSVGWGVAGENTCPGAVPMGACCLQGWFKCEVDLESDCNAQGGIYLGDGSICDVQNTCSACCFRDADFNRFCKMVPEWYCLERFSDQGSGGVYFEPTWSGLKTDGTGNVCAPSADSSAVEWWCDVYGTRTQSTTWGKLKSLFRK